MAETSYPWGVDATDAASADSRLYQAGWREIMSSAVGDGVVFDRSNGTPTAVPLYVSAPGTGTVITIGAGSAVVQGFLYDLTASKTIDVATVGTQPSAGQSRTDSVVLKLDPAATPASTRLSVQLHAGTPATTGSQAAPTLTKSPTGVWEVEIARLTRAASSNVAQASITQLQPRVVTMTLSTNSPGNPTVGQLWMDANGATWRWTGTAWTFNPGSASPVCFVKQTVAQSIPNNALTALTFDTEILDTDNLHSTASNTSRVVIGGTLGWWRVTGHYLNNVNVSGTRVGVAVALNGTTQTPEPLFFAAGTAATSAVVTTLVQATASTDYVELQAFQASGSAQSTGSGAPFQSTLLVEYVRP